MIIMDLEWNRGYDKKPLDEILQIGAVKIDRPGGPILDTFDIYIRPRVHKKFDHGAKRLPELDRSKASDLDFQTAWKRFRAWCGEEKEFASWGGQDLDTLKKNCEFWGLSYDLPEKARDLQAVMSRLFGVKGQQIALWRAVAYLGLPEIYDYHNALNDSLYTALVTKLMTREEIEYDPPVEVKVRRRKPRLSEKQFLPRPARETGPFPGRDGALSARVSRSPQCPLCERRIWVTEWVSAGGEEHWGLARCPEHGRFLCRLKLREETGGWKGSLTIPTPDEAVLESYSQASKGELYRCQTGSRGERPRKNRRRRRRRAPRRGGAAE